MQAAPAPVAPAAPSMPPARARVLRVDGEGNPVAPGRTAEAPEPKEQTSQPVQASRATRVFDTVEDATTAPAIPDWLKSVHANEADQIKAWTAIQERENGEGGLAKAYHGAAAKIGEQSSTIAALQAQLNDVLAASQAGAQAVQATQGLQPIVHTDIKALQAELDAIGQNFLEDIPGNVKKMTEISTQIAEAKLNQRLSASDAEREKQTAESLLGEYPGLFSADPKRKLAEGAYVDGLASSFLTGKTDPMTAYRKALDEFAKERGYSKPVPGARENADVTAMREAAATTAPASATETKGKGKIFKRSQLAHLQIHNPQEYKRLEGEIQKAYREGRVI